MKSPRVLLGNTEYRLLAVGAYSFSAFSVAALIQILSAGSVEAAVFPHLAKVAFTVMPLLGSGLALDFYCVGRPKMWWLAALLCTAIGALISTSSSALGAVLGIYSPQVAEYMNIGIWSGIAILILASILSWLIDPRQRDDDAIAVESDS